MNFFEQDFNQIEFNTQYDAFFANHSLHHVVELEKLFHAIQKAGKPGYFFLVNDMIGRNGHMSWPNAQSFLEAFWNPLPKRLKWNVFFERFDLSFPNFDCSQEGFEGIRAQDILSLLNKEFKFEYFVPFFSFINRIIDRTYGHNFNIDGNNPHNDISLLEYLWYMDEHFLFTKYLPPTQMIAKVVDPRLKRDISLKSRIYTSVDEACYSNYLDLADVMTVNAEREEVSDNTGQKKTSNCIEAEELSLATIINFPKNNTTRHFSIANKLMREGKLDEAIAYYRSAIAQNPNFAWFHHNLAEALVKQGQLDEAIAYYRSAIAQNPNFAWFHHNLAEALVKQGQLEESLIFFRKAIELNPNLVLAYHNLPANHSLLYQLGCIFLQQCSNDEAVTCFLKAIQVKSNFDPPYMNLRYLLPLNRLDEVIACCRKAIELQPDFARADICLGYALTRQGKHDEAIRCFQSASYKQTRRSYPSLAEKQCNSNLRSKPNFIICGVGKCGTTSLSQYIFQHPQVIPAIQKEIHFFSHEYSQGLDWYLAQFPSIPEGDSFLTGEASPSYLTYIDAEKRIFEHLPKVKLICLLRNPVDRTISAYYHCRKNGTENRSFEKAIFSEIEALKGVEDSPVTDIEIAINRQEIRYLKSSMYFYFIKKWMERFSSEQLLIVKSEDFYANTAVIMQQVFDFLEIPHYQAAEYKKYTVGSYKPIDDNLRRQLSEFFIPHNQKLENYLGKKFNWE